MQATWEWAQERLTPLGFATDLYADNYTVARFQAADQALLPWGATAQATAVFSQGLQGRDDAEAATGGVPVSQAGASPDFHKLNFDLNAQQPTPAGAEFSLGVHGQTTFGAPVFVAEQFSLDGPAAASGFSEGTFSVDEGFTARAELGRPAAFALPFVNTAATPYAFGEAGRGYIDNPTIVTDTVFPAKSFNGSATDLKPMAPPSCGGVRSRANCSLSGATPSLI